MRILLTVCYDGTNFNGYQIQPNKRTVEEVLNSAIFSLTGERVKSIASGRTDSGVHALAQKVHFDTNSKIPPKNFAPALNSILPSDVKIVSSKKVDDNFNARYFAKKKTYRYSCYVSKFENPLYERYKTLINKMPDLNLMKECAKIIEGVHDFKCFVASGSSVKSTVREIYSIKIIKKGNLLDFEICGNGFLYNMVRIIVGTLIFVGEGKIKVNTVKDAIESGNRLLVGKTMQAKGLLLKSVSYK